MYLRTNARMKIPHKIPGIAKIIILVNDFLNTYQSQLKPSSNNNTGIKIKRIRCGSIVAIKAAPPPILSPKIYLKYPKINPAIRIRGV